MAKKRYSRKEIYDAMINEELLEVTGKAVVKYVEVIDSDYNHDIVENNGIYSHMKVLIYDKNKNLMKPAGLNLGTFIQVWK